MASAYRAYISLPNPVFAADTSSLLCKDHLTYLLNEVCVTLSDRAYMSHVGWRRPAEVRSPEDLGLAANVNTPNTQRLGYLPIEQRGVESLCKGVSLIQRLVDGQRGMHPLGPSLREPRGERPLQLCGVDLQEVRCPADFGLASHFYAFLAVAQLAAVEVHVAQVEDSGQNLDNNKIVSFVNQGKVICFEI